MNACVQSPRRLEYGGVGGPSEHSCPSKCNQDKVATGWSWEFMVKPVTDHTDRVTASPFSSHMGMVNQNKGAPGDPQPGAHMGKGWRYAWGPQQWSPVKGTAWTTTVAVVSASVGVARAGVGDRRGTYASGKVATTSQSNPQNTSDWQREAPSGQERADRDLPPVSTLLGAGYSTQPASVTMGSTQIVPSELPCKVQRKQPSNFPVQHPHMQHRATG